MSDLRRRVAASRFSRAAALPERVRTIARHDARLLGQSARWLVGSREHTNFTYELTHLNLEHLAWWVADTGRVKVAEARSYMAEVEQDDTLYSHVRRATQASARRGLADDAVRLHKRIGWYALVRALRPSHVVETGTDKGLGSVVLAAALLRNGDGHLTTVDVNHDSGYLIRGTYAAVTDRVIGDSLGVLRDLSEPVDFFLHDSLHTRDHEYAEFETVSAHLSPQAVVLSDNAHATDALPAWAEATGRAFFYWQERPADHWYPGAGIGLTRRA